MQLLDQQAKTAANAATAKQGMKQEYRRTAEHSQHVNARVAEPANPFYQ
jgi:hypothetical protein